jgi:hypothetical protein
MYRTVPGRLVPSAYSRATDCVRTLSSCLGSISMHLLGYVSYGPFFLMEVYYPNYFHKLPCTMCRTNELLQIHDILVRIRVLRIRASD